MSTTRFRTAPALLGLALLGVSAGWAQRSSLRVGPMAGLSLADFHGADVSSTSTHTSFAIGGFAAYQLTPSLVVEPQVLYVGKGTKIDVGGGITGTFRLDYVEVPLLLKARYPVTGGRRLAPNAFVGPAFAFRTTCKLKASSGGTTVEESCSNANIPIKSTDFVLVFGVGIDVGPIAVQGRYDLGLTRVEDTTPASDVKTQAWIITVGFGVPLGSR